MKVFHRTYFSFLGVIILQAVLLTVLISGSVGRSQDQESYKEAKAEASIVYDDFNSWKRSLWGLIVDISKSKELAGIIGAQRGASLSDQLLSYIRRITAQSGAEFVVVKSGWSQATSVMSLTDVPERDQLPPLSPTSDLTITKEHPYVEVLASKRNLYLCGNVRVRSSEGKFLDLFILKKVDEALCAQLTSNLNSKVIISVDDYFATGTIGGTEFRKWLGKTSLTTSYYVLKNIQEEGIPYIMVVQQSGPARIAGIDRAESEATLYVCSYFSLIDARNQIAFINRSILAASLVIALFTALVSALLSKAVTDPISKLSKAMSQLKSGKKAILVDGPRKGEIGELFQGFNEMSAQLDVDKASLSEHLREIVRIKDYDDKIFDSIQERILVIDSVFKVEKANKAFLDYLGVGVEAVVGKNIDELSINLFDAPIHESIRAVISGALPSVSQTRRTPAGETFEIKLYPLLQDSLVSPSGLNSTVSVTQNLMHCIMIVEDVTRRIAYEDKMRQAEKLASISILSAGVAHEINNPLGSILANVQNLIRTERDQASIGDLLIIEKETKRIARIVRNLLEFSSASKVQSSVTDLNEVITDLLQLLGYSISKKSGVEISVDLEPNLPQALMGEDECKQVILNLIMNSLEAIDNAGKITIETKKVSEGRVELVVSDTGKGIPTELLPRVFDPFFSTKAEQGNSGLGLSVVYGLVSKIQGTVNVKSHEGQGTEVRILLPAAKDSDS